MDGENNENEQPPVAPGGGPSDPPAEQPPAADMDGAENAAASQPPADEAAGVQPQPDGGAGPAGMDDMDGAGAGGVPPDAPGAGQEVPGIQPEIPGGQPQPGMIPMGGIDPNIPPEMQPPYDQGIDPNQAVNDNFLGVNQVPEGFDPMGGMPDVPGGMGGMDPDGQDGVGEDDEDVDEYFDDAGDIGYLPADHPLMARLQAALTKQLTDEHERVDLQLREKEEEVRKVKKNREDTGVQMYGVQHQLAKMQTKFERTHDNFNIVSRYRVEAEKQHELLQKQYETKKEEADDQLKRVLKAQEELNQLNRTLKQVEEYNEVMKSEIAVTRRTTYRAEESVVNLEKQKKGQDVLIDSMNEEIKRLNEQKTLYQAQLISQKEETAAARNTLKEAAIEIEKIIMSKKTLLDDWQKSLFGMQQRDKALQAIKELIKQKQDDILQIESEISGVRNETKKQQEISEDLTRMLEKMKADQDFLNERSQDIMNETKRLSEQFMMLKNSIKQTEDESAKMDLEKTNVEEKKNILEKSIMSLHTKTKQIRDDIINHASQQKTIEKSSANLLKQTKQIYQNIALKEIDIENFSNEISRVRIDNLNCEQQNELLQKKLDDLITELKEREKEVLEFEQSIKKRHNIIDKKQLKVDKLNRIWAQLREKGGDDENSGPMEAKKNNIIKRTHELEDQIVNTQKQWISNQTDLIERQNTHMQLSKDCEELRTQKSILEQKKLRLNSQVQNHEKEIRQLEVAKNNLDFEMNKLNDLFYKNTDLQEKLKNDNFNIENEFKQKLKELENQSIRLENNIASLQESKADILAEIVEAERQILLWERKIQLEKEMQDALDPTIGQTEIVAMKKEIHRMNLRYEQLRKKQEEMIKDMERSVFKRETIQLKYLPKVEKKNAQDKSSQGKLSRQIANLKQTLKHTTENTMKLDQSIEQRLKELEEINRDIQQNKDVQAQEEQMNQQNYYKLLAKKMTKAMNNSNIAISKQKRQQYTELLANRFRSQFQDDAQCRQYLEESRNKNSMIDAILEKIQVENPDLDIIFRELIGW